MNKVSHHFFNQFNIGELMRIRALANHLDFIERGFPTYGFAAVIKNNLAHCRFVDF
jgi:hypothetical protein